jgi:transmembrane sensor
MALKSGNSLEFLLMDLNFRDWVIQPKPETERYWKTWLKNNPDKKEDFLLAKELIQKLEFKRVKVSEERYDKIFEKTLLGKKSKYASSNQHFLKKLDLPSYWRVAAMLVAAAFISLLYFSDQFYDTEEMAGQMEMVTKTNDAGRKSQIYLPDGTIVWLNSQSSIQYKPDFSGSTRSVELSGEAYFEVAKDPSKKFIVKTSAMSVTAIGTQFNVNAYSSVDRHQVALAEGKIMVQKTDKLNEDDQKVYLDPGQSLSVFKSNGQMIQSSFDPKKILSWRDGIIYFEDAVFEEVVEVLQRWYGKTIIVQNIEKAGQWQFSSEFNNETLENVMQNISYSKNFGYTIEGETVNIIF